MEGVPRSTNPPSLAALAADVAVHGHVIAGSAGVETALADVPTLFLDGEGWSRSPLYDLGEDRIVFTDCEKLWEHCKEHWERPGGLSDFGLWGEKIYRFDPFRDGRAAQRMGTYLNWLLEGLRAGLPRRTVMADAAERYAVKWGRNKIVCMDPPGIKPSEENTVRVL
jgi:hypothetical protein